MSQSHGISEGKARKLQSMLSSILNEDSETEEQDKPGPSRATEGLSIV